MPDKVQLDSDLPAPAILSPRPVTEAQPAAQAGITLLRDWASVLALESEWRAILLRSDADRLFLSWEWIAAWHSVTGHRRFPFVIVARDRPGRLIGLAPFYFAPARLIDVLPYRGLRVMGDYPTGSEYLDFIVDREYPAAFGDLARALAASRVWDFLWLPYCAGWTGASYRLRSALATAGLHTRMRDLPYTAVSLGHSFDEYLATLSSNGRSAVRRARRSGGRDGMTVVHCTQAADIERFLDALFDLHGRRWASRGELGTFRKKPDEAAFYRRFAPVAFQNGWLRLAGIQKDGRFVAVQIGYVCGDVFYQIQEGFDPDTAGAGNALRAAMIEACIAEGLSRYDFLAGMSEAKMRWGARRSTGQTIVAVRPGLRSVPLGHLPLWPTGRYLTFAELDS